MADHQFLFALKISGHPQQVALLGDLAECVLKQVGYAPPAITDIVAKLRDALEQGSSGGVRECDMQFRSEAGQLLIVVSYAGGREWRVVRALPD